MQEEFDPWSKICIHSLKKATNLNNAQGYTTTKVNDRYAVFVLSIKKQVKVKPENLRLLPHDPIQNTKYEASLAMQASDFATAKVLSQVAVSQGDRDMLYYLAAMQCNDSELTKGAENYMKVLKSLKPKQLKVNDALAIENLCMMLRHEQYKEKEAIRLISKLQSKLEKATNGKNVLALFGSTIIRFTRGFLHYLDQARKVGEGISFNSDEVQDIRKKAVVHYQKAVEMSKKFPASVRPEYVQIFDFAKEAAESSRGNLAELTSDRERLKFGRREPGMSCVADDGTRVQMVISEDQPLRKVKEADCASCGKKEGLQWCRGCYKVMYCGKDCQKKDRKRHKSECFK